VIEAQRISKSFGATRALDEVSFSVSAGEIVGLLGPNGSGKTTLLRILTGFFPADDGSALVAGVRLEDGSLEVRRRVGFLPEQAPLYVDLTVEQLLGFAADVKMPLRKGRAERIEAVLADCGLAEMRRKRIGALSKGYRQRVGIAQALVGRPQVLILDEPTAGLDPATVLELRALVRNLKGRTTILLSSHILADVASVCDRVLILHRGRLVLAERLDHLRQRVRSASEIVLKTRADPVEVEARLGAIDGIESVRCEVVDEGRLSVRLAHAPFAESVDRADGLCAAVAAEAVARGWPVLELGPRLRTLEDLFVDLLGEKEGRA
jgi:ABC-2 type transport system ATP-binding protein